MFRKTVAALALASIVGCSSSTSFQPFAGGKAEERTQLAAYAATALYPSDVKPSSDIKAAALINPKNDSIKLLNFSDEPIRDANVWVNGSFVHKVDVIPSHGSAVVTRAELYDHSGHSMDSLKASPTRVEVQMRDHLYALNEARTE